MRLSKEPLRSPSHNRKAIGSCNQSVLFSCGMDVEMLYRLLVTLRDYTFTQNWLLHLLILYGVIRGDQALL